MSKLDSLQAGLESVLGAQIKSLVRDRGELTVTVSAADYSEAAAQLRSAPALRFEQLIDLCGVDYSSYKDQAWGGGRFHETARLAKEKQFNRKVEINATVRQLKSELESLSR